MPPAASIAEMNGTGRERERERERERGENGREGL